MAESDDNWRNLSPDDPRYNTWQLVIGVLQRDESRAKANCYANFQASGLRSAVLTWVDEVFDSCGRVAKMLVTSVATAGMAGEILDAAIEPTLALFVPALQGTERTLQIPASSLVAESRLRLIGRAGHWKAEAFQCGLDAELQALKDSSTKLPAHIGSKSTHGNTEGAMTDDEEVRKHMERLWAQRQDYLNECEAFRKLYGRDPTLQELQDVRTLEVNGIHGIRGIPSEEAFGIGALSLAPQPVTAAGPTESEPNKRNEASEEGTAAYEAGKSKREPILNESQAPTEIVRDQAVPSALDLTTAPLVEDFDFDTEAGRIKAIAAYVQRWDKCSEASLARTAGVDPADLSKWKRGQLPLESGKKARIEQALRKNDSPTLAAGRDSET